MKNSCTVHVFSIRKQLKNMDSTLRWAGLASQPHLHQQVETTETLKYYFKKKLCFTKDSLQLLLSQLVD